METCEELLELYFSSCPHLDLNHNPLLFWFFCPLTNCLSVELISLYISNLTVNTFIFQSENKATHRLLVTGTFLRSQMEMGRKHRQPRTNNE